MLGFLGGPLDGTYSVHPRHMNVKPMRNINDEDLDTQDETFSRPEGVATDVSFLIHRVRLGEMCREALDSRPIGAPEDDVLDQQRVLALDRAFEKTIADLPPYFQPKGPIPAGAPKYLGLQRNILLLATYSRRARINRPFILKDGPGKTHQLLRDSCLSSARMAVSIGIEMVENSKSQSSSDQTPISSSLSRRMGIVIGHLFTGCAILALNAASKQNHSGLPDDPSLSESSHEDEDLKKACAALTAVGKETAVAASLTRTLKRVLHRCRGQRESDPLPAHDGQAPGRPHDTVAGEALREISVREVGNLDGVGVPSSTEDGGLDQLWMELMDSGPDMGSWDDLFTGLDEHLLFGS